MAPSCSLGAAAALLAALAPSTSLIASGLTIRSSSTCSDGHLIPNSNRTDDASACTGSEGDECAYRCDDGYMAIGRHVCQTYTTRASEAPVIDRSFFGGRCERLCGGLAEWYCPYEDLVAGYVPVRWNSSDADGHCLATKCLPADDALKRLARGAYGLWRLGRDDKTGIYSGSTAPDATASEQSDVGHIGSNGLGLMAECIAAEMGWISKDEAAQRVQLTMSALAGEVPGFNVTRNQGGWLPTFFKKSTGHIFGSRKYTTLDTGLNAAGVLFAKAYFLDRFPSSRTKELARLADALIQAVRFEDLLCNEEGELDESGTAIPFLFDDDNRCSGLNVPEEGLYKFSELHTTVALAYERVCGGYEKGKCPKPAYEKMWEAWQGRRLNPGFSFKGQVPLSTWPSYTVHLPFYASHSFNTDKHWQKHFKDMWKADWNYYTGDAYYAGENGRYGLAAGFTDQWCSVKNSGYEADQMHEVDFTLPSQGCRTYSPYAVAGYLPAAPDTITEHLFQLLAAGEAVFPVPDTGDDVSPDFVLLRKSLLEPGWNQTDRVSMIDFSSELFGLSTKWLGVDFFRRYTEH